MSLRSFSDYPFDGTDSSTTSTSDRNSIFEPRAPFGTDNDPKIPIVSMKTLNQRQPRLDQRQPRQSGSFFNFSMGIGTNSETTQRNDTNSVFDLSQFGIRDEAPIQNATLTNDPGSFGNVISYKENTNAVPISNSQPDTKIEYPFESIDKERKTALSQKGPSIRVISGFKDHANKPVLLSQGAFVDFTAGEDNSKTDTVADQFNTATNSSNINDINTPPVLRSGIALPGVRGLGTSDNRLSPIQVKPFKPFVVASTPTRKPVVPTESTTTAGPAVPATNIQSAGNDEMSSLETNTRNNAGASVNVPIAESNNNVDSSFRTLPGSDPNSIPVTSTNNRPLPGSSVDRNIGDTTNIGGALVNNHISADDITNDLFNNRVTGPVPDGIPAGEKLKIDNIYPVVSNPRQNIPSINSAGSSGSSSGTAPELAGNTNDTSSTGIIPNGGTLNSKTTGVMPSTNTAIINNQGTGANNQVGQMSNIITNQGVPNTNQNLQIGSPANMNNRVNTNILLAGSANTGVPINGFRRGNGGQFINNNIVRQQMQGNVMQGRSWQGQNNPVLPNQPVNRNLASAGGQQILNNQVFNNRLPGQRLPTNIGNNFPVIGNSNGQNRIGNIPNTVFPGNGQSIQAGVNRNVGPNGLGIFNNNFQNFQNVLNPSAGIRTFPRNNMNQFNNNFPRGVGQTPFNQNVNNNGFGRNVPGNGLTGLQNGAIVNQNGNMEIRNAAGNSLVNGPHNNFIQGNRPKTPFTTEQFNRNIAISGSVPQSNVGNTLLNPNSNDMVMNPNVIDFNNRLPTNQGGTGLNTNAGLNNQLTPGGVFKTGIAGNPNVDGATVSNNNGDRQTVVGRPNAIVPRRNANPDNTNTGFPPGNAGGLDQSKIEQQNNQIDPGNNVNTPLNSQNIGNSNFPNTQQNIYTQNGRMTTNGQPGSNPGSSQSNLGNNLFVGPDGQMRTTNNLHVNQQNVFIGPNGPLKTSDHMIPNTLLTNNVPIETLQQRNGQSNQSTRLPTQSQENVLDNTQSNQNMPSLNPNQMNQNVQNSNRNQMNQNMQNLNPNQMNQNVQNLNPNRMNQNVQNLNPNQMNQNVQNLDPNQMNQNVQNLNPNRMNQNVQNLNPNQMNQNVQNLNPNQMNQNVQNSNPNQINQNTMTQNTNSKQTTGQNQIQNNLVNPKMLNQNMNSQQAIGPNQIQNNLVNQNMLNQNINTQQTTQQNGFPNGQINQNVQDQNMNTQQMVEQNRFQNNQINPNFQTQNMNAQQTIGQSLVSNIQNTQARDNFGINNGFRGQNQPQNVLPGFMQTGRLQNRFQNILNVPAIGQNPTFMTEPGRNFQTPFINGPPRNIQGQFVNGFPNNFGQFSQTVGR